MREDTLQTGGGMDPLEARTLSLYRKLLSVMEQENGESGKQTLDRIEHNMSQKIEILREIEELTGQGEWIKNAGAHKELSGIIKKIIDLNEVHAHTVRKMKHEISKELYDLHKSRSAYKAYNAQK